MAATALNMFDKLDLFIKNKKYDRECEQAKKRYQRAADITIEFNRTHTQEEIDARNERRAREAEEAIRKIEEDFRRRFPRYAAEHDEEKKEESGFTGMVDILRPNPFFVSKDFKREIEGEGDYNDMVISSSELTGLLTHTYAELDNVEQKFIRPTVLALLVTSGVIDINTCVDEMLLSSQEEKEILNTIVRNMVGVKLFSNVSVYDLNMVYDSIEDFLEIIKYINNSDRYKLKDNIGRYILKLSKIFEEYTAASDKANGGNGETITPFISNNYSFGDTTDIPKVVTDKEIKVIGEFMTKLNENIVAAKGPEYAYNLIKKPNGNITVQMKSDAGLPSYAEFEIEPCLTAGRWLALIPVESAKCGRYLGCFDIMKDENLPFIADGVMCGMLRAEGHEFLKDLPLGVSDVYSYFDLRSMFREIDNMSDEEKEEFTSRLRRIIYMWYDMANADKNLPRYGKMRVMKYHNPKKFTLISDDRVFVDTGDMHSAGEHIHDGLSVVVNDDRIDVRCKGGTNYTDKDFFSKKIIFPFRMMTDADYRSFSYMNYNQQLQQQQQQVNNQQQ